MTALQNKLNRSLENKNKFSDNCFSNGKSLRNTSESISIFNTHVRYNSYVVNCINVYNDKILHVLFTGNAIVTVIIFCVSLTGLNTWRQNVILGKRHTLICNLGFKLCQSIRNSLPVNYVEILWWFWYATRKLIGFRKENFHNDNKSVSSIKTAGTKNIMLCTFSFLVYAHNDENSATSPQQR